MSNDNVKAYGEVICEESTDGKNWKEFHRQKNLFTIGSHKALFGSFISGTSFRLRHFAVGDGTDSISKTSTTIPGEYARYEIDQQTEETVNGNREITNTLVLDFAEGNGTIRKLGLILISPTTTLTNYVATNPSNSWILSNVINLTNPKIKDNNLTLRFTWVLRIE